MIHRRAATAVLVCALGMSYTRTAPAQVAPGRIAFEPYSLRTYDGQVHEIELGKLTVPESRAKPGGPTVTVAFLRLKALNSQPPSGSSSRTAVMSCFLIAPCEMSWWTSLPDVTCATVRCETTRRDSCPSRMRSSRLAAAANSR